MFITGKFMNKRKTEPQIDVVPRCAVSASLVCDVHSVRCECYRQRIVSTVWGVCGVRCLSTLCCVSGARAVSAGLLQCAVFMVCSVCSVWCLLGVCPWGLGSDLTLTKPAAQPATGQCVHLKTGRKNI